MSFAIPAVGGSDPFAGRAFSQTVSVFATGTTANVKTGWVELFPSTTATTEWCDVSSFLNYAYGAAGRQALIDIGVGASGAEVVKVANLPVGQSICHSHLLPLRIPSGSRVAYRIQTNTASDAMDLAVALFTGTQTPTHPTSLDTLGAVVATSEGTNLPTSNTYVQLVASTSQAYQGLYMVPCSSGTSTASETSLLTVGVGAAAAEVAKATRLASSHTNNSTDARLDPVGGFFWGSVPAGSRVAAKQSVGRGYRGCVVFGVP